MQCLVHVNCVARGAWSFLCAYVNVGFFYQQSVMEPDPNMTSCGKTEGQAASIMKTIDSTAVAEDKVSLVMAVD